MKHIFKYWSKMQDCEKVPRRYKKFILGKRLSKTQLKQKIKNFKVEHHQKHIYESSIFNMKPFCPKCGCEVVRRTGNMAVYPELWEKMYCLRCGEMVCEADNSTYFHVLEEMLLDMENVI